MLFKHISKIIKYLIPPILLFILGWILYFLGLFSSIVWLDDLMHFLGGIILGYTYFFIVKYFISKRYLKLNIFFMILFVTSLVAFTTVLWEFYQFFLGLFTNIPVQLTIEDTLLDMFLGIFGGLLIVIFLGNSKTYF
tara:strand:- start:17376 stop:17786 length:411 start_codon:yes stop_codon:yes gene_type:complete